MLTAATLGRRWFSMTLKSVNVMRWLPAQSVNAGFPSIGPE
jgi:hypothetical protein